MKRLERAVAAATITVLAATGGWAQGSGPADYSLYQPIYELAKRLEARYAKPVTVELPLLVWRGETQRVGFTKAGVEILNPRPYTLNLPANDPVFGAPALSADIVRQALDAYHRQNPARNRFRVTESQMGFHILPSVSHDENGREIAVRSLLDTPVSVSVESRTATEHVHAILQSVSIATGIPIRDPWNFDARYAANGNILRSRFVSEADRPYRLFRWGASEVLAREALEDLLNGSATTMTWELACFLDATAQNRPACSLGVAPLAVGDKRTDLFLDRCTKCKYVPR